MTYEYSCIKCNHHFDVIKSVKDMDVNEFCPRCESPALRQFVPTRVHLVGTSVQNPEWNPGLGCVVKNKDHRKELCKQKGLVEIGNDYKSGESHQKEYDRAREDKHKKSWESV